MSVWDRYQNAGSVWASFKEPGDQVIGIVRTVRDGQDFDKNPVPELVLDDEHGGSIIVTASLTMLRQALLEKRPEVGDRVRITYTGDGEARAGRTAPKLFTVDVKQTMLSGKTPPDSVDPDTIPF